MNRIAEFEKVSYEQFKKDWLDEFSINYDEWDDEMTDIMIRSIYDSIALPERSTKGSAGYDFRCPSNLSIATGKSIKIPTGIRCKMNEGWVLQCYPRSSYGFKFGVHLANSVGIVDEDYYYANNEGHIMIKLVNDSSLAKPIKIMAGDAFCQGVFVPFGITVGDNAYNERHGGFGSTGR